MATIEIVPESIQLLRMSDEDYFSEKYKDYISNTRLGMINPEEGGSLEKFLFGFKEEYSASFELGSVLHASVLQPDYYYISQFKKPGGKIGIFVEKVFEYRRNPTVSLAEAIELASSEADYYSNKMTGNRIRLSIGSGLSYYLYLLREDAIERQMNFPKIPVYVSDSTYSKYTSCMSKIRKNKKIINLLDPWETNTNFESFNEYAILCEVNITIGGRTIRLRLKAKLDNFVIAHADNTVILNDLKTTSKSVKFFMGNNVKIWDGQKDSLEWFDGSFQKYHYYRQMAVYIWMLQCYLQKEFAVMYKSKVNIIVVETIPNFDCRVFPVGNEHIKRGLKEFNKLLTLVAEWKLSGNA